MASLSFPDSCAYTPSDLTIFKMKVVEDMAALSDKQAVLAFLLERCGDATYWIICECALLFLPWSTTQVHDRCTHTKLFKSPSRVL